MGKMVGKASVRPEKPVYIAESVSVAGTKESEGPLGLLFDQCLEDDLLGCENWEEAESKLQETAVAMLLEKSGLTTSDIRYLFAGDLLGQSIASSFGVVSFQIPLFGLYGACSTCGEALALGSLCVDGGYADRVICVTSSHFASAEKEFRFPLGYGNQRPLSASWTVTGSGAFLLTSDEKMTEDMTHNKTDVSKDASCGIKARIAGFTIGKIADFGLKDSMNMGACMAPAAASTLQQHFVDYSSQPEDYDKIITGDLGVVGQKVLLDLMREKGFDIADRHMDCGIEIYDAEAQDTHAGGSGCGCCAVTLAAYILKQLQEHNWKRVLFMPTGALLSKTSFNEGKSVPGICHALILEAC